MKTLLRGLAIAALLTAGAGCGGRSAPGAQDSAPIHDRSARDVYAAAAEVAGMAGFVQSSDGRSHIKLTAGDTSVDIRVKEKDGVVWLTVEASSKEGSPQKASRDIHDAICRRLGVPTIDEAGA